MKTESQLGLNTTCDLIIAFSYSKVEQTHSNFPITLYKYENNESNTSNTINTTTIETLNNDEYYYSINDIITELNKTKSSSLANKAISLYDEDLGVYMHCGVTPLKHQITVPVDKKIINDINNNETNKINKTEQNSNAKNALRIKIKIRYIQTKLNLLKMELIEENQENLDEQNQNLHINEKSKRSKERKIGYIIEKVFLWRKLYNGFVDDTGHFVKLTLEEAADRVGIAKKSLDDYLIQLRIGKSNSFNFNEHKNDKVGVLRAFVKKQKCLNENKSQTNNILNLNEDDLS